MIEPIITPTPVQKIDLPDAGGNRIWIKRDDLLPFSLGGNKVRIAKAFLDDCRTSGCNAMILYGDRRSNLCRVLSGLCRAQNLPALMIETSEHGDEGPAPFNERMISSLGVEILKTEKEEIAQAVDEAMARLRKRGLRPYYIYGDRFGRGNEGTAALAYAQASREILLWEEETHTELDYIFTACGTGSTAAGLTAGMLDAGARTLVVGISISSRGQERARGAVEESVRAWFEKTGKKVPSDLSEHIHVETAYSCGGYGVRDARVEALVREVFETSSVTLDLTYTGKALRGTLDYLDSHGIHGKNVLFLHTGGTPLWFDDLIRS